MINNKILALKYRPQEFDDLIGQEVMTQTITNGIKQKKTPNAYLLTGIRGIGKTTTARLIAKALNCQKNLDSKIICSSKKFCKTCEEIINSNHIDILEMDAASKTGIDDIRELIESSKYNPTSATYKIFIIDEVHMLSKQAFNGLLKTLEEPPSRLKFILATTEARKIPVTILSRCQRFDLKRVSTENLCSHLKKISEKEGGKISEEAVKLISKSAEGSVRDAISLLDRALISQSLNKDNKINESDIRKMLGLANKTKIISLIKEVLSGNDKTSLEILNELIEDGIDAKNFLNDILEVLYLFSRKISLGSIEKDFTISEEEANLVNQYSENINMQDIGLFWQLTIKTIDDLKIVGNENLSLEMYIMQLTHIKNIENDKSVISNESLSGHGTKVKNDLVGKSEKEEKLENLTTSTTNQLKNTEQVKNNPIKTLEKNKVEITNFQSLIDKANLEKEVELKYDLERNVKLVSFNKGNINISFNEKLNKNFIKNLSEKLLLWTGQRWIISLSKNNEAKSIYEKTLEQRSSTISSYKATDLAKKIEKTFPDAKLMDVREDKNE